MKTADIYFFKSKIPGLIYVRPVSLEAVEHFSWKYFPSPAGLYAFGRSGPFHNGLETGTLHDSGKTFTTKEIQ